MMLSKGQIRSVRKQKYHLEQEFENHPNQTALVRGTSWFYISKEDFEEVTQSPSELEEYEEALHREEQSM